VRSTSADQEQLAIYGSQRSNDGALTLMIINKTDKDLTSDLALQGFSPATSAQVYNYSAANLKAIARQPDQAVTATGFRGKYPANSITLVVIPKEIS
jgi:alpha-L-arabinofuranosidase